MIVGFKKYELWYNAETQKYEEQNVQNCFGEVVGAIALTQADVYGIMHQVPHLIVTNDTGGFETVELKDCFQIDQENHVCYP